MDLVGNIRYATFQVVLVGNKSDLPASEKRDATVAAAVTFAQQNQLTHLEASARSVRE
jgi:hypothetical protein